MPTEQRVFITEHDPPSKQRILRAALMLFVRHGVVRTNVRMIGTEAGYTNPALFKFFVSKDALVLYLFERCYSRLYAGVAAAAAGKTFQPALDAVLDAFLSAMDDDLEAVLFVQDTLREVWPRVPAALRRRSLLRVLRRLFARGLREGCVEGYRSPDVPVAALIGLLAQFGRMVYFGEVEGPVQRWRDDLDLALRRMAHPGDRGPSARGVTTVPSGVHPKAARARPGGAVSGRSGP